MEGKGFAYKVGEGVLLDCKIDKDGARVRVIWGIFPGLLAVVIRSGRHGRFLGVMMMLAFGACCSKIVFVAKKR